MKFRFITITAIALILAACNFTLAEDVTPPPGYVPPTPVPTLGPLHPVQAPSTENGKMIFAAKCAACHGETGMGDGEQGIQLGVTVPAFGLPEIARPASPSQWYTTVTRGNMERFMPPFASLNDQERWDVVAYALTLHTSEEQITKGRQLFETNCASCSTDFFKDQAQMAALSEVELARLVKQGNDQVKPFAANLSDEDLWAVTAYLRTLSFDTAPIAAAPASSATPEPFDPAQDKAITVTETLVPAGTGTPSTEGMSVGTEQAPATSEATAVVRAGFGSVSGSIENKTGKGLPSDLKVTLHGFDHGADPSAGPQEVFSEEGSVREDGTFVFENVEMPLNRIFIADITIDGAELQSGFAIAKEGNTSLNLPPIVLHNKTEDISKLIVEETRIFFEYGTDEIQVYNIFSLRNSGEETIMMKWDEKGELPFIKAPAGSSGFGFEPMQDGEKLIRTQDGYEVPPSKDPYGLIAFASIPRTKEFEFSQQFVLPVQSVSVFVPEGVKVKGASAQDLGVQSMQNFTFQIYELDSVGANQNLKITVSGTPQQTTTDSTPAPTVSNQNLLIGAGALGLALILAGAWMYLRDRKRAEDSDDEEAEKDEFESSEEVMDAIIALDDLHRDRKISEGAYQKRRSELKEVLKRKM